MIPVFVSNGCTHEAKGLDFQQLQGKEFILVVNRISVHPDVQLPSENLTEKNFNPIEFTSEYEVSFSEDLQTIYLSRDSISGTIVSEDESQRLYDLKAGLFAGGRFIVWIVNDGFEAEYTVYGSGVPIIQSERGKLVSR